MFSIFNTAVGGKMTKSWGMTGEHSNMASGLYPLAIVYHLVIAILFFLILLFLAMLLWEKIKTERLENQKKSK